MEITESPVEKRTRTKRSPEFLAFCRKARHLPPKGASKVKQPKQPSARQRAMALESLHGEPVVPLPVKPVEKHFRHAMTRDKRTKEWRVRVPSPKGRTKYVTTGETDYKKALKVVDASGVPQLAVLARAKCLTQSAASIILSGQDKTCAEVAKTWLKDLALDQAKSTCAQYEAYINMLFAKNDCAGKPPTFITREMLYSFVNDPEKKESTREVRLNAINSFYRHAAGFGHVPGNIASTIRINTSLMTVEQREMKPALPFTENEYRTIMDSQIPRFWRVATAFGYWLGLRLVDVCYFERATLNENFAVLYPKKTGARLVLPIHHPLIGSGELKGLFRMLMDAVPADQILCFPEQAKMYETCAAGISSGFVKEIRSLGIRDKSFHGLRHTFKLRLEAQGVPIQDIAALMGHASTAMTEQYGRGATAPSTLPQPCDATIPFVVPDSAPPASSGSGTARSETA